MDKVKFQYKVIEQIQRFYTDETYYKVHTCKSWYDVCCLVDPCYMVTGKEPKPIKYYTNSFYGETWIFPSREIGFSASPDTISYTVFVDNAGMW